MVAKKPAKTPKGGKKPVEGTSGVGALTGIARLYKGSLIGYDEDGTIIGVAIATPRSRNFTEYVVSSTGTLTKSPGGKIEKDEFRSNPAFSSTAVVSKPKTGGRKRTIKLSDIAVTDTQKRQGTKRREPPEEEIEEQIEKPAVKKAKKGDEQEKKEEEEEKPGDTPMEEEEDKADDKAETAEEPAEQETTPESEQAAEAAEPEPREKNETLATSMEESEQVAEEFAGKSDDPPKRAQGIPEDIRQMVESINKFMQELNEKEGGGNPVSMEEIIGHTPEPKRTEKTMAEETKEVIEEIEKNTDMNDADQSQAVAAAVQNFHDNVQVLETTAKALADTRMKEDTDADVKLSGGELQAAPTSTHNMTGDSIMETVAHGGGAEVTNSAQIHKQGMDPDNLVDEDRKGQRVTTMDGNQLLSKDYETTQDGITDQGIAASANAVAALEEATTIPMDTSIPRTPEQVEEDMLKSLPKQTRMDEELEPAEDKAKRLKEERAQAKEEARKTAEEKRLAKEQERTDEAQMRTADKLEQLKQEIANGDAFALQKFNDMMAMITPFIPMQDQDAFEIDKELRVAQQIAQALRKTARVIDVKTAKPATTQEMIDAAIQEHAEGILAPATIGESGLGAPVFAPDEAVSRFHALQKTQVLTITAQEVKLAREQMQPFWNEFRTLQMNAGIHEMETMPTRLVKDGASTLRVSSAVRPDVDQQQESFMKFMFFILHVRLSATNPTTWRHFFMWSAAMGYGELTQAQINWLITGNINGDIHKETDWRHIKDMMDSDLHLMLDEEIDVVQDITMSRRDMMVLSATMTAVPSADMPFPSRNTSPSAPPRDNSTHPDGSSGDTRIRRNRETASTTPHSVFNIPDPRFSTRGGESVPNTKIVVVKNPKYDPKSKLKPGDPKHEPEFITEHIPDVGVGSKDVEAAITAAESDRLLDGQPIRVYAAIHPQACDRYLGSRNYQRLSLEPEKYLKSYSQHGWSVKDFGEMFNWNMYVMQLYGSTLYAFVTDIQMQKVVPVYGIQTPDAVVDEYMELNELVKELTRYQHESTDRASRVTGGGGNTRPLDEQLGKFFKEQEQADKDKLFDANAITISFPDQAPPGSDVVPDSDRPGPPPDNPDAPANPDDPDNPDDPPPTSTPSAFSTSSQMSPAVWKPKDPETARMNHPQVLKDSNHPLVGPLDVEYGITNKRRGEPLTLNSASSKRVRFAPTARTNNIHELDKRARMFKMFSGAR